MGIGIVGCGRFGSCLATTLARKGADVLALDRDHAAVQRVSSAVSRALQGDASEEGVLAEAGFGDCTAAVVAIGANMEGSILAAMTLKELKVPFILAKAVTDQHGRVLEQLGVNRVLYPDRDMAAKAARILLAPSILDYAEVSEGTGVMDVPAPAHLWGQTLAQAEIRRRYGVVVLAIEKKARGDGPRRTVVAPGADDVVEEGDIVVIFGSDARLREFERALRA
jgi:trk system potassium uptake protein TrkA